MLNLFNTLTKTTEEIHPLDDGIVRMYTCGPTVYRYAHIGNLRTYMMADWIRRTLELDGLDDEIERVLSWARSQGVRVDPVSGDVVEG